MATVNLGNIKFKWKGTYSGGSSYTIDDVVEYNGSSYICKLASTGNLPTNTTYFDVMSQAGTNGSNGTDLTSTLTTQGDLVYRDGSGLQRLGAGVAGQVLQTGGAGANPSWSTVSSDYVKLGTATGSDVASISLDGFYTSDYKMYKIYGYDIYSGATGNQLGLRLNVSGSASTSGVYVNTNAYQYTDTTPSHQINSGNSASTDMDSGGTAWFFNGDSFSNTSTRPAFFEMLIADPTNSTKYKLAHWKFCYHGQNANIMQNIFGHGLWKDTSAHTGVTIFGQAGNIYGTFTVYGIKA